MDDKRKQKKRERRCHFGIYISALVVISFICGVIVGVYRLPPFSILQAIKITAFNGSANEEVSYQKEGELLRLAFTDPLYEGPKLYPRADSFDAIHKHLQSMLMPVAAFKDAYGRMKVAKHQKQLLGDTDNEVLSVTYEIDKKTYTGYAYFREGGKERKNCAAFIIPGSGRNKSLGIILNDPRNYHFNIFEVLSPHCDVFAYVKPNEDFLAIHNDEKKLNYDFIINYMINNGGSYSSLYLVHSMAIVKHLKSTYDKVVILGLSQGGYAALLNSLQSGPDGTVISSGFSVLFKTIARLNFKQIFIPDVNKDYGVDKAFEIMKGSATKYLFTYGKQELGTYKIEAEEGYTCSFFESLNNVSCLSHSAGHVFPGKEVEEFLISVISR